MVPKKWEEMLEQIDSNRDGSVTFEEFLHYMSQASQKTDETLATDANACDQD
jgi:Ca2+-binding EF-hand superfamily protein